MGERKRENRPGREDQGIADLVGRETGEGEAGKLGLPVVRVPVVVVFVAAVGGVGEKADALADGIGIGIEIEIYVVVVG